MKYIFGSDIQYNNKTLFMKICEGEVKMVSCMYRELIECSVSKGMLKGQLKEKSGYFSRRK